MTTLTYLSLLLYAEGASDYRLLTPLLRRLTEQLCRLEARGIVDVGDVIGIEEPRRFRDKDRATRIVPVREIEAWTLVDGEALRGAFGTTLDDQALRIAQRPRDVESILDPKLEIEAVFRKLTSSSQRRRARVADFYDRIGERVDLGRLEQVPAFKELEKSLRQALLKLGILAAPRG
jgi:hypothetical protein